MEDIFFILTVFLAILSFILFKLVKIDVHAENRRNRGNREFWVDFWDV